MAATVDDEQSSTATVAPTVAETDAPIDSGGSEEPTDSIGVQVRPVLQVFPEDSDVDAVDDSIDDGDVLLGPEGESVAVTVDDSIDEGERLLDLKGQSFAVGPALPGDIFSDAVVETSLGFGLSLTLNGPDASEAFNAIALECFEAAATCPTSQIAIVFDGVVLSAPTVNAPTFDDFVSITGQFTQQEAEQLADSINSSG